MAGSIIQNFRGYRALMVHPAGPTAEQLGAVLLRLGLSLRHHDPAHDGFPLPASAEAGFDVIFFDADQGTGPLFAAAGPDAAGPPLAPPPLVALIGVEAPGRLARAVTLGASAYVTKPLRSTGIFTALFIAFNEDQRRREESRRLQGLERKLHARRAVVKAILAVMEARGLDDEGAFRLIRKESMRRRMTIEAFCQEVLSDPLAEQAGGQEEPLREQK